MVLVIQWLVELGLIIWNFAYLSMQFMYEHQPCVLKGIVLGAIQLMDAKLSSKSLSMVGFKGQLSSGLILWLLKHKKN